VIVTYIDATEHRALEDDLEKAKREPEKTNKELQSTNEELETMNDELRERTSPTRGRLGRRQQRTTADAGDAS